MCVGEKYRSDVEELLAGECRGFSAARTIAHLLDRGLISFAASRAYMARRRVKELVSKGSTKVKAMEIVAEDMGCSFATVRNYLYHNYK